jgi:hypothetical protein
MKGALFVNLIQASIDFWFHMKGLLHGVTKADQESSIGPGLT